MSRIPAHPFPPAREMGPGRKAWLLCCGQWEGSTKDLRGLSILKWIDKQGFLSRDRERVKKGGVGGLSGKRNQYKQGVKVRNPECRNDKGWKYMKGKQRKKDRSQGLERPASCPKGDTNELEGRHLCGYVTRWACYVADVPGEWELGKGFVERAGGILELMI